MAVIARAYPGARAAYTRNLKIDFRKAMRTPGCVLLRVCLVKAEGKKMWVTGRVEDENGEAYLTAEGLFLKGGKSML